MNKQEIFEFITKNTFGFLATVCDNKARVRGMETFRADENGLIFYTGKVKDVFKQVSKNPEVEVCYYAKGLQVRVRGKMEIFEDLDLKKEIVKAKPFLHPFYKKDEDYDQMGLMRLKGKATFWSLKNIGKLSAPFIDL